MVANPYGTEGELGRGYAGPFDFWHAPLYENYGHTFESHVTLLTHVLTGFGAEVTVVDARNIEPAPVAWDGNADSERETGPNDHVEACAPYPDTFPLHAAHFTFASL